VENPENLGFVGLALATVLAWIKIRPAMRKIVSDEDASLRSDLLDRITHLEVSINAERTKHHNIISEIRHEHDLIVREMQQRHDVICKDYEDKLNQFQARVDRLMEQLIERNK